MPQRRIKTVNYTETLLTNCTRNESCKLASAKNLDNWKITFSD